ncbi:MAG TPA: ABC transporter substrate-binding protein [Chloroflexota bacterium]|jgi:iron(III) transport system substrate-binding protein
MARRITLCCALGLLLTLACAPAASGPVPAGGAPAASSAARDAVASPTTGEPLQALVEGARREGELAFIWTDTANGEGVRRWIEGFNRAYGLNLRVNWTTGPSMPEMANRVAQEYLAGRPASTDVLLGSENHVVDLLKVDAIEPVDWLSWAPHIQEPRLVAGGGGSVQLASRTPGITYNTNQLKGDAVPRSTQDLLKASYKGRLASTPYAANWPLLATPEAWGEQRTFDYVTKLADQLSGLLRCAELERVASGEYDALALDCGPEYRGLQVKGAPVEHVIPTDAALIAYWHLMVPRNAAHPNAAKLWVDYLLSREAQDVLYETEFADHHLLPGSKTAPDIARAQAAGAQFVETTVPFAQRNEESIARTTRELVSMLRKQ